VAERLSVVLRLKIPDESELFYRVHQNMTPTGAILPSIFKPIKANIPGKEDGLSVDWSEFCLAIDTLNRASNPDSASKSGVLLLKTGDVRKISVDGQCLEVLHDPIQDNQAHSLIMHIPDKGPEKLAVRIALSEIAEIVIPIPQKPTV